MSAPMSSAMSRTSSGRSMSAVRPCPCRSTAMTWWRSASAGRIGPNISPDPSPPCSRISGRPAPCVSIVQVDAVDLGVLPGTPRVRRPIGGHHGDAPRVHGSAMPDRRRRRQELIGGASRACVPAASARATRCTRGGDNWTVPPRPPRRNPAPLPGSGLCDRVAAGLGRPGSHRGVPVDVVVEEPVLGHLAASRQGPEHHRHQQVAQHPRRPGRRLPVAISLALLRRPARRARAEPLERGERRRDVGVGRAGTSPSTTASSIAMDAPCPEEGEVACAASPMMTIRSLCHVGTVGKSYVFHAGMISGGAR